MLSIIIPALNEEKYLPRLLESIKKQRYKDYEVIVSDGNSKDKTREIAKKLGCKVIVSNKRSPAHQRNQGAKAAKGDILLFLDADSVLPDDFLPGTLDEFKTRKLSVAGFYVIMNSKDLSYRIITKVYNLVCFIVQKIKPVTIGACILVKKRYHDRIKGFDESIFIGEDHDYSERIAKIGKLGLIKSNKILFSTRRFDKEGKIKMTIKLIYGSLYVIFKGPIKKKIVDYKFGDF